MDWLQGGRKPDFFSLEPYPPWPLLISKSCATREGRGEGGYFSIIDLRKAGCLAAAEAPDSFAWTHGVIDLHDREVESRFRFYEDNRYKILDPYTTLPNDPWYPRIRFNMKPMPAEWCRMLFSPYRPYMVATWVPGKVIADKTIEFERQRIWWDGKKYPDVLVFDKDYNLKFALDGNPSASEEKQGYVYPWSRSHFQQICPRTARVRVDIDIDPTDIIYGFYFLRRAGP
jgi:hypothetical protein